jgi:hypothetical protein
MAVVYQHVRKDTNEVFYVGIGANEKRAYRKDGRNSHWKNIVKKVGYYVEIIYPDLEWKLACNMEQYLIEAYGRIDLGTGLLVNKTIGGEGVVGNINSEETRRKISESNKGKVSHNKGKSMSEEQKKKISESLKNKYQDGYVNAAKGVKHDEDRIKKNSEAQKKLYETGYVSPSKGKKHTEEHRRKNSEAKKGISPYNKGVPMSNEQKIKCSNARKMLIESGYESPMSKSVVNNETGEIYKSLTEMCKILGLNYGTMVNKLSGNKKNNTSFKYI